MMVSLVFLLQLQFCPLHAQDTSAISFPEIRDYIEELYGPSADLINGEKYHYPYSYSKGDPFLNLPGNHDASIQIKGKVYEKQEIKYDIYNHLVVLEINEKNGVSGSIVLRNEWLDQLILGGFQFKKFPDEFGVERFGQVIFEGKTTCFYFWKKRYMLDIMVGENHYSFSDPIRQPFIMVNGHAYPYTGMRSFLKCFSRQDQLNIRTYLKENRIRFRKATDQEMQSLMEYINQ
ncbi:MAG: hypothetical protein KAT15_31120 [Bacteroidales bacterium]|nr:hypothetical protein [Bacteroidales bacterium]